MARPRKKGKKRVAKTVVKKTRKKRVVKLGVKAARLANLEAQITDVREYIQFLLERYEDAFKTDTVTQHDDRLDSLEKQVRWLDDKNELLVSNLNATNRLLNYIIRENAPDCPECGEPMELVSDEEVSDEVDEEGLSGLNG